MQKRYLRDKIADLKEISHLVVQEYARMVLQLLVGNFCLEEWEMSASRWRLLRLLSVRKNLALSLIVPETNADLGNSDGSDWLFIDVYVIQKRNALKVQTNASTKTVLQGVTFPQVAPCYFLIATCLG